MKLYQSGRSMVEMLGVLAIIGVLSVGAIAGYSKAMMKYKLNKQTEQLTTVINAGLRYAGQWNFENLTYTIPYLIKLHEIPQEMIKENSPDTGYIYDVFNTTMYLAYTPTSDEGNYTQLFIELSTAKGDDYSLSICRNLLNTIKEFHANLWYLQIYSYTDSGSTDSFVLYGDSSCSGSKKCLKDMLVSDIDEACRYNIGKTVRPRMKILWKE